MCVWERRVQTQCLCSGSNTPLMNILEEILSSDDDDLLLCEEADSETLAVSEEKTVKKRKRDDLEEGEIEEESDHVCSNGFFFDTSIMKKVPGCVDCNNKRFCKRV